MSRARPRVKCRSHLRHLPVTMEADAGRYCGWQALVVWVSVVSRHTVSPLPPPSFSVLIFLSLLLSSSPFLPSMRSGRGQATVTREDDKQAMGGDGDGREGKVATSTRHQSLPLLTKMAIISVSGEFVAFTNVSH